MERCNKWVSPRQCPWPGVIFDIYINDLPDVIDVLIKLFADNAKIYAVVPTNATENRVQSSLKRAVDWADIWRMLLNIIKCHHLHLGNHESDTSYTMESKGQVMELETVNDEKDLWVIIDHKLSFRDHVTSKVNTANRNLGIILGLSPMLMKRFFVSGHILSMPLQCGHLRKRDQKQTEQTLAQASY